MATFVGMDYIWRIDLVYRFALIYRVTYLIYRFSLTYMVDIDYEDFSSMPYDVTYSNIVYNASSPNPVRVPPPGYII